MKIAVKLTSNLHYENTRISQKDAPGFLRVAGRDQQSWLTYLVSIAKPTKNTARPKWGPVAAEYTMFAVERVLWGVEELTQKATEVIVSVGGYLGRIMGIIRKENKKKKNEEILCKERILQRIYDWGCEECSWPDPLSEICI